MLSACRVLDLTDERGQLAGMILAQLGAEVIAVEPPGGVRSRRLEPSPAQHLAFNRGKRSIVLALDDAGGRRALPRPGGHRRRGARVLRPGHARAAGPRLGTLEAVNPRLVLVSISAFGQDGPHAGWAASDLIVEAAACELFLTGDADRAPVRVSYPQALPQRRRRRRLRRADRPGGARGQRPGPARRRLRPGGGGHGDPGPAAGRRLPGPAAAPQRRRAQGRPAQHPLGVPRRRRLGHDHPALRPHRPVHLPAHRVDGGGGLPRTRGGRGRLARLPLRRAGRSAPTPRSSTSCRTASPCSPRPTPRPSCWPARSTGGC